jgi:hypothetical protein
LEREDVSSFYSQNITPPKEHLVQDVLKRIKSSRKKRWSAMSIGRILKKVEVGLLESPGFLLFSAFFIRFLTYTKPLIEQSRKGIWEEAALDG